MSAVSKKGFNDGRSVPALAFGTATAHFKHDCSHAILLALKAGFRFIDTAHGYENEVSVGTALKTWKCSRDDVFICSKWGWTVDPVGHHDPEVELKQSLDLTGLEYLDLYLIHAPNPPVMSNVETWKKMEDFHQRGLLRSIGVSNFRSVDIENIAKICHVKPVVNQVEYHPYCFHDPRVVEMVNTCKKYDIAISPYTSLAPITHLPGGPVDSVIQRIGRRYGATPAQILLAWARQHSGGGPVVTTASKDWQYQQILDSESTVLAEEEVDEIAAAGRQGGVKRVWKLPEWTE